MGDPFLWMVDFMEHPIQKDDVAVPHFRKPPYILFFQK